MAQSQSPKQAFVDDFFLAFQHFLAITSAGVDECGARFPERKEGYLTAYERARNDNLDVFMRAESSADFAEFLSVERSLALAETHKVMTEYCAELPRFIEVVAGRATQLRLVLVNP